MRSAKATNRTSIAAIWRAFVAALAFSLAGLAISIAWGQTKGFSGEGSQGIDSSPALACPVDIRPIAVDPTSAVRTLSKVPAYTQGLIFTDGWLYESTGQKGHSAIYRLSPEDGERSRLFTLDRNLFGEGLAKLGKRFYQLTWRSGLAFAYEIDGSGTNLSRTQTFRRAGEGWGLTVHEDELVLSDGSDRLSFVDPDTFEPTREVAVRLGEQPLPKLNELELIGGTVFANVYGDSSIVGVDPESGCVTAVIDTRPLVAEMAREFENLSNPICSGPCSAWDFVVNGIAYDPQKDELYITGKNWPRMFVYRGLIR